MQARQGEVRKSWFRCDRYYHTDEGWWFLTRENNQFGPFSSHKDAETELLLYLRNKNVYHGLIEQDSPPEHPSSPPKRSS
jgi:hypothetical protein